MTDSMSPADVAAVVRNNECYGNNNGGMFNNDWEWIIILLLFEWSGRGFGFGGGFGGNVNSCGCCEPCATQADVRAAVDQQTLISKLDNNTLGICDSTYALNNDIRNGFHGVDNAIRNLGYNVQSDVNAMSSQLAQCCCDNRAAIADVKYQMATDTCAIQNIIQNTSRDIIDNANANSRAILDFLTQDKIATLTAENQSLKFQASQTAQNAFITANQEAQTAEIIRRLGRDCPVPAYVVPNPNCCYNANVTFGNGCGCGSF